VIELKPPYFWVKIIRESGKVQHCGPFFTIDEAEEYATNPPIQRADVNIVETFDRYPVRPKE
jgi:hypothetical protein